MKTGTILAAGLLATTVAALPSPSFFGNMKREAAPAAVAEAEPGRPSYFRNVYAKEGPAAEEDR